VATPDCPTIDELAERLGLPKRQLAKTLACSTAEGLVLAVVRADYELALEKLSPDGLLGHRPGPADGRGGAGQP
jgi:prolyl-tRNA editing enzyme YbaK/EbsC (Cys-tRNA(Pro) deacylase)